jgi:DNA-binding LacI/PurR family transcriptional regulator
MDGWRDTLQQAGLPVLEDHWVSGTWSAASGERSIKRLFAQYPEMDAVFVANDQMSLGVLKGAHERGLEIPKDLGIVGFDGIPESTNYWPPLTTIYQDLHHLGSTAVEELIKIIEDQNLVVAEYEPQRLLFQPKLVVRASTQQGSTIHQE